MAFRRSRLRPWHLIVYGAAALALSQIRPLYRWYTAPGASACAAGETDVAAYAVKLLRCDPQGWSADNYRLENENGLRIWIANDAWAVDVERNGVKVKWDHHPASDPTPEQQQIWDAYQAWARNRVMGR